MALSKTTKDHDEIRQWAESRGAVPGEVESTESKSGPGILRFMFPKAPHHNDGALKEIEWDDFFEKFDANGLELLYQDVTKEGAESNFNKLIYPENESPSVKNSAGKKAATKSASKAATRVAPSKTAAKKATPAKKTVAKKTPAKNAATKQSVPAKKAASTKSAVRTTANKTAVKKAVPAKKTAAKKGTARALWAGAGLERPQTKKSAAKKKR